jgi:CheY-like chemotaxis protein
MVDDSEDDLRLYRRALKDHIGYTLHTAINGEDGLASVQAINPSLIIIDYKLPDMDGIKFMTRLTENSSIAVPVIMLTGEGSEPVAVEAMKMGASDYVVKDTSGGFLRLLPSVTALNEFGVMFSLDDFGTGYSSLQYLKRLPLDQLKIDQTFVRDISFDSSDRAIVRTTIAMAHSLNLGVIAEGVETEEQRQLLLSKGCTRFQGYLFGKPVPIDEFEALLK